MTVSKKTKLKAAFFLAVLSTPLVALSAKEANNSVYVELGGNAAAYSINYEKNIDSSWGIRTGLGTLWANNHIILGVPVMINKYWGDPVSNHKFETGLGVSYFTYTKKSHHTDHLLAGTASIGYRYLPKTKGMTYKVAFTPIFEEAFIPWIGLSAGYVF